MVLVRRPPCTTAVGFDIHTLGHPAPALARVPGQQGEPSSGPQGGVCARSCSSTLAPRAESTGSYASSLCRGVVKDCGATPLCDPPPHPLAFRFPGPCPTQPPPHPPGRPRYEQDLAALVAFPSVSALPEHGPDLLAAAAWLAERLRAAGLQARGWRCTAGWGQG